MSKAPPVSTLSNILHYCELSDLFTSELYMIIFIIKCVIEFSCNYVIDDVGKRAVK